MKNYLRKMRGGDRSPPRKPLSKIGWSWLGAFLGIYSISLMSEYVYFTGYDQLFLVGSFGASAVLIYGAPQVEYAQPRNLVGGHLLSALVGITAYKFLSFDVALISALAVSLSIVAMHLTKTIHPPGGATALIAVIGSSQIHSLGYLYVLSPIGTGVVIMLLVALVVNNLSSNPKRHYPVFWF
ncbi:MAG: HPP family protein [Acidiferrobacterales bacterium]